MEKENQYSIVAREAYLNILGKGILFEKAWSAAAEKIITSDSSRNKGCPRATFLNLCASGDLKDIREIGKSESINYAYAKFAITE